ncbi:Uncharacterised protein [Klebsiella pneumoniae]|nr:hypothetical protein HMPREF1306_01021 [Klebsiella pneumoniae subsp. pneumoniae WGLW2]QPB97779.1 hypothetical protein IFY67_04043 [Klebsiella pneumoniae]SWB09625.1 Uncharacterised protein [Klebsiella pneumoniae]SYC61332.1 Uncharacterised protein [Klebsiella pneumoniae]
MLLLQESQQNLSMATMKTMGEPNNSQNKVATAAFFTSGV